MGEGIKPWFAPMEEKGIYDKFIKDIPNLIKNGIYNKKNLTTKIYKAYTTPFFNDESYIGALAWLKDIPMGDSHHSTETM